MGVAHKFAAWIQISRLHSVFAKLLLCQEVCKFWGISAWVTGCPNLIQ